jgi:plasmid replication initiation protein
MITFSHKELIIKKTSAMIQTNAKGLTLHQRKIINYLIHVVQSNGDQKSYTVYLSELKKACGISTKGNEELKENIKKLTQVNMVFNIFEKDNEEWEINVFLVGANINFSSGKVVFSFSPFIHKRIIKPLIYSPLNLLTIANFKCIYSIILYEFLRDYLNAHQVPFLTIEQLKSLLNVDKDKYPEFKYFKREVLNKAVKEINKNSDLQCNFKMIKEHGNKYNGIQFKVKKRSEPEQTDEIN